MEHKYASTLTVLAIMGIVGLSMLFAAKHTAMASVPLCPPGREAIMVGVPGGGNQIIDCQVTDAVPQVLPHFDTYTAHPQGDLRRQRIAQRGFNPQYYTNLAEEGMQR